MDNPDGTEIVSKPEYVFQYFVKIMARWPKLAEIFLLFIVHESNESFSDGKIQLKLKVCFEKNEHP